MTQSLSHGKHAHQNGSGWKRHDCQTVCKTCWSMACVPVDYSEFESTFEASAECSTKNWRKVIWKGQHMERNWRTGPHSSEFLIQIRVSEHIFTSLGKSRRKKRQHEPQQLDPQVTSSGFIFSAMHTSQRQKDSLASIYYSSESIAMHLHKAQVSFLLHMQISFRVVIY